MILRHLALVGAAAILAAWAVSHRMLSTEEDLAALSTTSVRIEAWNAESRRLGPPGEGYPFVTYASVLEPHVETELVITNVAENAEVEWRIETTGEVLRTPEIVGASASKVQARTSTPVLRLTLTSVGNLVVRAKVGDKQYSRNLWARYVRREIREMSEAARERYLNAAFVMCQLSLEEGRRVYGPGFRTNDEFTRIHLNLAGDRDVDRLHSGVGFLMQHLALSNAYELALRAIDPSIALPYWDFTIDRETVRQKSPDLSRISEFWRLDYWSDDWFGNASASPLHTVERGRFAYQPVTKDWSNGIRNPYGYLRSPWNMNKNAFVTRCHSMGHVSVKAHEWPSCQTHLNVTTLYDDVYSYMWAIEGDPHGPVHVFVGGYLDTGDVFEDLAGVLPESAIGEAMQFLFPIVKGLWRDLPHAANNATLHFNYPTYCSDDTPQTACHMICPRTWIDQNSTFATDFLAAYEPKWPWLAHIGDHWRPFARWLCTTPFAPGEHLESASPADPSFWPIHPTIDRLFIYKRLVMPFKIADFANNRGPTTWCEYYDTSDCMGHHPYDVAAYNVNAHDGHGRFNVQHLTVGELFNATSPENYKLDYVYDHFNWHHCDAAGFYFPKPDSFVIRNADSIN